MKRSLLLSVALSLASCTRLREALPAGSHGERVRSEIVQDVTLHTVELGATSGPLRIVLHGGPGLDHTYLRPWLDPLAKDARVIYVDLRGHGHSSAPPDALQYTLDAAAADIAALIHARNGSRPADIVAHDFGAAVAIELAARHPEVVRRLVLISPLSNRRQVRARAERVESAIGAHAWEMLSAIQTPQGTLRDPRRLRERFGLLTRAWWHQTPPARWLARMSEQMLYRGDTEEHFEYVLRTWDGPTRSLEVRAPTLVVTGDDDRLFTAGESTELADRLAHGRVQIIENAGHFPFIERTLPCLDAVENFLRTHETRAGS